MLRLNLLANYIGQGWRAIMALAFVPLYIKYLGIEAYGLIGLFAVLQTSLGLLDLGMKPALGREMARYTGGAHNEQSIWNLLRSIELVSTAIVVIIAIGFWGGSHWLATDWVKSQVLPLHTVSQALALMGLVAALQFIDGIYMSCLAGLQRQVTQNVVVSSVATARGLGAIGILAWVSPTIQAFFVWQCVCSVVSVILNRLVVFYVLPSPPVPPRFSGSALLSVWRFAAAMMGISFLSLLVMQLDKILLSRLLSLEAFGYYALAGTVAGSLLLLVSPISTAFYPRFNELVVSQDQSELNRAFHNAAQLVTVVIGSAASILIIFSELILCVWTNDRELSARVAPVMAVLTVGTLLNCLLLVPHQMQLAYAWTSLTLWICVVAVSILVPTILVLVPIYGPIGAAWTWVALNASYCIVGPQFMFRRILTTEKWTWYLQDVIAPLAAAITVTTLARLTCPVPVDRMWASILIASIGFLSIISAGLAAPVVRQLVWRLVTQLCHWRLLPTPLPPSSNTSE